MDITESDYYKVKRSSDQIKDIWKAHLKSDDLESFKTWIEPISIWDLIAIDGQSMLHAAAQNRTGRVSDDKMDIVFDKFKKNFVSQDLIEISSGKSPVLMALSKGQTYAVCRLTVDVEDLGYLLPDIEGHSVDF